METNQQMPSANVENSALPNPPAPAQSGKIISPKNIKKGLLFFFLPFLGIITALIGFVIIKAISYAAGIDPNSASTLAVIFRTLNFLLGIAGFVSILGFFVGIIVGIIFLVKKDEVTGIFDVRSGLGDKSVVPDEVKGWNWGAAGLTWIWGLSNGVWISTLSFIPFVNIIMWFVLGAKGNEWAWRNLKWENPEKFKEYQNKWKIWGIIFFLLSILSLISKIIK